LQVEVRSDDVDVFLSIGIFTAIHAELAKRSGEVLSDDPVAICEAFAKFAASLLQAGSTAESHIWADAVREHDEKT
jgi:hypothetical protein